MTSRRLLGLLAALLMFHLTLVRTDVVCGEHGTAAAHQAAAHGGEHEHHAMTAALVTTSGVADQRPCDVPTRPQCCEAFASCSVSLVAPTPQRIVTRDPARAILATAAHQLASQAVAPEPPPPRA